MFCISVMMDSEKCLKRQYVGMEVVQSHIISLPVKSLLYKPVARKFCWAVLLKKKRTFCHWNSVLTSGGVEKFICMVCA